MKKIQKPADVIREYLYRNSKEQELPVGYIGKDELKKKLNLSENQFSRLIPALVDRKEVHRIDIKRVKNGRIHKMAFFKFGGYLAKSLGL